MKVKLWNSEPTTAFQADQHTLHTNNHLLFAPAEAVCNMIHGPLCLSWTNLSIDTHFDITLIADQDAAAQRN